MKSILSFILRARISGSVPLILYMTVLTLAYSCRTIKNHNAEQQRNSTVDSRHSHTQWSLYDSTNQYWYFHTDSTFYYHPTHGLYGRSGLLSVSHAGVHGHQWQQQRDSTLYMVDEQSKTSHSSKSALRSFREWILTIGIFSVLVLMWLYRRKRILLPL